MVLLFSQYIVKDSSETAWTPALQMLLSMGFSQQECQSEYVLSVLGHQSYPIKLLTRGTIKETELEGDGWGGRWARQPQSPEPLTSVPIISLSGRPGGDSRKMWVPWHVPQEDCCRLVFPEITVSISWGKELRPKRALVLQATRLADRKAERVLSSFHFVNCVIFLGSLKRLWRTPSNNDTLFYWIVGSRER